MSTNVSVFTHEVGFYGVVNMALTAGGLPTVAILATGGDINIATDPIFSTGVWGAGWYNAANQVAYAVNAMKIEGSAAFELAAGDIFAAILDFGFENRADTDGHIIQVLPQGEAGFSGPAWCSGCSFDASTDSIVTGNFNYSSGNLLPANWTTSTTNPQPGTRDYPARRPPAVNAVYPFWASQVMIGSTLGTATQLADIVSWSANYTSEINFLTLCTGSITAPIAPDYIMVGGMDADGQFTIFKITDELSVVPAGDSTKFQQMKACRILMRDGSTAGLAGAGQFVDFSNIVYNSGSTSIQTGGTYIQSDISFTAVGDGTQPPMLIGNM